MLFSSITFIYYFLPILLIIYFLVPSKYRNLILFIFSLIFYFLGEPKYIVILLFSCFLNFYFGILIEKSKRKKLFLIIALSYNILQLLIFKYTDFFIFNINQVFNSNFNHLYLVMPIGISFYTFQIIAYLIDIYKKNHSSASNFLDFTTYVVLFPQLIAGPIVRYKDIQEDLKKREINYSKVSLGLKRFIIGLSKKVLLANVLGEIIKNLGEVSVLATWFKAICYPLQLYFDFSGYSDMAIGLGLILGFQFRENFNYPFIASSITDFWHRWHISLSSWFKDYVYIPLGGNRVSKFKWLRNLFVVWFLTGFWHGASWNFILWGLFFFLILLMEKLFFQKFLEKTKVLKYFYTILIIIISFVIFNAASISEIITTLKNLFFLRKIPLVGKESLYYLKSNIIFLIISITASTPLVASLIKKVKKTRLKTLISILEPVFYLFLLVLVTAFLIDESYSPFLYFRF